MIIMFNNFFGSLISVNRIPNLIFDRPSDIDLNIIKPNVNYSMEFIVTPPENKCINTKKYLKTKSLDCRKYIIEDLVKKDIKDWINFFEFSGKINSENEFSFYIILKQLKDNTLKNSIHQYPKNRVYHNTLASILLVYLISNSKSKMYYESFYPILFGGETEEITEKLESQIILEYLTYLKKISKI